ncbi:MAG: oligosaccharide flippase family protein [Anaerobutyricum hallii]|uniref:oligosaccharide flippase family protein n=1 Tax=Anaerobutyricum hallii TaxID=39488 RepID=UPI002A8372C0|nr:oligosaccharide flippase family protein [Anaerobutyricum hallii]MDY4576872.1 oligosaccharide flippase family protein [Anaerobutyricum hallii]
MNRGKYLAKNTALFALGSFGTKMISFFLVPLYTNVLNTGEYGTVDLVMTISTVLAPIITFNIGEAVMRFCLDKGADQKKITDVGVLFSLISIFLGALILPVSMLFAPIKEYGIYLTVYCVTSGISQIFIFNLRGLEKLLDYAITNIIHTFLIAVFNIVFLLGLRWGIKGYFTAYILSNCLTALYAFWRGNVKIHRLAFDHETKTLIAAMVKYSIVLVPNSFMWWIMNSSDRIMVTSMVGIAANGIYAISYKVPTLLSTFSNIFNQAWSYSAIKENDSEDINDYSNTVYKRMVAVLSVITAGLLMIMKPFLMVYVEKSYYEAWKYTPYLLVGFLFLTLGTFLSTSYTVNKDSKGFLLSGSFGAIINIILNFILIPIIGVSGAALATCISYISVYSFRAVHTQKYIQIDILYKKHLIGYALILGMCFTMFLDNLYGQLILILEFVIVLLLYKDFVVMMMEIVFRKVIKRH